MTRLTNLLVAVGMLALLAGCPKAPPPPTQPDGGVEVPDAGVDAGTGGEIPDAGVNDQDAGPPPELTLQRVLPPRGPSAGGIWATFQGTGFVRGTGERATVARARTTVKFGGNLVQDFAVIDDETLEVRVPPGTPGPTLVTIENDNGLYVCEACFTWFEEVVLKGATPKEGPLRGGTEVTLTGEGFTADLTVLFGTVSVAQPFLVTSKELRVTAPRGLAPGEVDVQVFSKNGVGTLRKVFRYHPDLRISALAPLTGPVTGGTSVTLSGTGFTGATAVQFGGVDAVDFTVVDDGTLTATVPPGAGVGAVPVTVETPREAWTVKDGFTYVGAGGFALYGVFPHVGPAAGGNTVTLTGEGLDAPNLAVTFGGVSAQVTAATAHTAQVTVPARAGSRKADVTVTDGGAPQTRVGGYTFRLEVTGISPDRGPMAGGTVATLTGTGLPEDAQVHVGGRAAAVTAVTETSATLTTPPGQGGHPTGVWVYEAADPENEALLPEAFTFEEALAVGRLQPDRGAIAGGTLVSVLGTGFGEGTLVRIGGKVAKDIKVVDAHTLSCRTPRGDVGTFDVTVERAGQTDLLEGGFSYFDPRSVTGGLSGGPLTGTLNVTVLDSTPGFSGAPVPLATVMLGVDPHTPFQGQTDNRGQLTFSDPSLVKAQTVSAYKEGYASVTVTQVGAENLTVYISRTGGDGSPGNPPPSPPPSVISGKVTGFKAPRPLNSNETLEARVFVAQTTLNGGVPFQGLPNRQGQKWQVTKEGGEYLVLTSAGLRAVYAVLGIFNQQTQAFEPHLMGIKRKVTVSPDAPATNQNIILDMHLDMTVPITVEEPLSFLGLPANNDVYAWLDLGSEGFIPNPNNWAAGAQPMTSVTSQSTVFEFPHFPRLDGSNFIFMNLSMSPGGAPYSIFYRRQPGDISTQPKNAASPTGVTLGPMLPTPQLTHPVGSVPWNGTITWDVDPGPQPDLHYVVILKPTLAGTVTLWSMVLPGSETQVTLPPPAVQKLQSEEFGNMLFVQILSSRSPRFSYNQWTYDTLSGVSWSSYTVAVSEGFLP